MNKIVNKSIRFITFIILCIVSLPIFAEDNEVFTAKTVEGIEVTYTIISEVQKTCKVGYTYDKKKGVRTAIDNSTSGSITIPSIVNGYSVVDVADYAFSSCENLTSILIPNGVTYLGKSAFNRCTNAVTISIPNSVSGNSFGDYSFAGCESLKEINIPEGVPSIGSAAFRSCKSLLSVNLPSSVKIIYEFAFDGCSSLSSILLPDNLQYIGTAAFSGCCITSLKLPKSFTTSYGVNNISYSGTDIGTISSLNKVIISKGVSSLYEVFKYCGYIETVICYNEEPVNAYNCWSTAYYGTLYVPKGSKDKYKANENWNRFSRIIEMEANENYDDVGNTFVNNGITYKITSPNPREVQVGLRSGAIDKSTSGSIIIPSSVKNPITQIDYAVKSIGIYAFSNCKNLTSIEIPSSVISIGGSAFSGCLNLSNIDIPNSIISIDNNVFYNCKNLSSIEIPNSVTCIGESAFAYSGLTSVGIPNSVTSLGGYVFSGCEGLASIIVPSSVISVGDGIFRGCSGLYSVQIPETITSIGDYFFSGCSKLNSFIIPNSIKSIGQYAFQNCTALNNLTIGNSVSSIVNNAFDGCNNLRIISFNCSEIDAWFKGITSIKEIVFGDNVKSIGSNAFNGCKGLAKVSISNSITSIGSSAFTYCDSLTSVEISDLATWCCIKFSNCYSNPLTLAQHLYQNGEEIINLTIPNTVTSIGDYAFYGCYPLTSVKISNSVTNIGINAFSNCSRIATVEIPNSVITIGDGSFYKCSSLSSVIIPNSVKSIGGSSFSDCYALTSISLPNSITSIGKNAFYNCNQLSSLNIPSSVESIGDYAFSQCSRLTSVTVGSQIPIEISNSVFSSRKNATLYVPIGSKEAYKDANCWKDFKETIEYGDDGKKYYSLTISAIGDGYVSFSDNTIMGTVQSYRIMENTSLLITFSPNVGNHVNSLLVNGVDITSELLNNTYLLSNIYNNTNIEVVFSSKITFSDPIVKRICVQNWDIDGDGELSENEASLVTSLGGVFRYTDIKTFMELKYFTGLSSIDSEAFESCRNLTSVIIPNSVITIGNNSFYGCNVLENLCFSDSLASIESGAFGYCYSLKDVKIPNSVVSIGDYAFSSCTGIVNISIPESVTDIGRNAFTCCSALKKLTIPYSVKNIGQGAFSGCTSLTAIMIPNSITNIGVELFRGCSGLTSVTIEDGIKSIGMLAFYFCDNLKSLSIPSSLTDISNSAFQHCESLSSIVVDSGNAKYDSRDNCNAIIETSTNKIIIGCKNSIIPNSVKNIGVNAFNQCIGLKSLSIPDGIECIDRYAFSGCINLVKITIPNSVKCIEERAFEGCSSLKNIVIPGNITTLGFYVFQNCTSLARVESKIKQPFEINKVFLNLPNNSELYVPYGTKALYESTKGWNVFGEIIETDPQQFDLNIVSVGNGSAMCNGKTIRNQSSSINVIEGSSATISLYPDTGYRIASVKVNEQDVLTQVKDNQLVISVTDNTNVEIVFEAVPISTYNLTISTVGNGYVAYDGYTIRSKTSSFDVIEGTNAVLTFSADESNRLKSVKLNGQDVTSSIVGNQYTITNITANTTIEVVFEAIPTYALNIVASGNGSASYDGVIIRNQSQNFTLREGASAVVSFSADNGYRIASVKVNNADVTSQIVDGKITVNNITQNTNVEVVFEEIPPIVYALSITATGNGSVTYDGNTVKGKTSTFTIIEGSYITVQMSADDGYRLKSITLNGQDVTADVANNQYTTPKMMADAALVVVFEAIPTFALTIKSSAFGSVKFGDAIIANRTETFSVREGTSATMTFTPDDNGRLHSIMLDGTDITKELVNGQYTISNIRADQSIEAEFVEDITKVTDAGIAYTVTSYDEQTVVVAAGNYGNVLTVPASFTAKEKTWTVVGIDEDALKDNTALAAIVWNPEVAFTAKVSNPNLLLYVKDAQYAPTTIQNVVVNNQAENIVLVEAASGNDFYCPQAFTAKRISYEHNYSMISGYKTCQGWETLVLPFDVTMMINAKGQELTPYSNWQYGNSLRPFWLYEMTTQGWKAGSAIKANTPYIISMPNNEMYDVSFNQTGNIQFIGTNVEVKASTEMKTGQHGNKRLVANYQTQEASADIYALNVSNEWSQNTAMEVEGSTFIRSLRSVHPFEAYLTVEGSNAPLAIPVFENLPTGINEKLIMNGEKFATATDWYTIDGRKLQGEPKQNGIYIIKGKKVRK